MSDIDRIKQKILIASRVLYAPNGITDVQEGFSGHVSHRLPGGGSYVVAGHTHVEGRSTLGDVGYGDLVVVDMETGARLEGSQPLLGENVIHTGVYRARGEVNSVIHVHPFWCTVWSLVETPTLGLPVFFTGRSQVESEEDGEALGRALGDESAILLPGHGIVTIGETVEQACILTASLNEQARKLFHTSLLGEVPRKYVELLMTPQKASIESDSWLWYESKLREKGLYPELP
jgi:ribulose-5-phosphate 4-epimerase/fuculose-1-phosphate aldolase